MSRGRSFPSQLLLLPAALSLFTALSAQGDDFHLKDGNTVSGTIVGYDDSSFKVQTSYGFALVRKDQVVSITISDASKSSASSKRADNASAAAPSAPQRPALPDPNAAKPVRTAAKAPNVTAPAIRSAAVTSTAAALALPVAGPVAPAPPVPEQIREDVTGTIYTNETYGFRMYKPPDWDVIPGARSMLPGAIAAMGTVDQTTYLLIGQAPAGKSLASDVDATDQRLRGLMDNFRPLGESHTNVSGIAAIERKFRGTVDDKEWSGTVVFFSRGGQFFTIFGMTVADTDLVQIQENVIARAISSVSFQN
jgi:hypothetical protein